MKVKEIITIKGWVDGSGWQFSQCYSDQVIDVPEDLTTPGAEMDWSWWELNSRVKGEDTEITVAYYRPDYDPMFDEDEPLAEWSIWESELREAVYMPDDEYLDRWFDSEQPVCLTKDEIKALALGWSVPVDELMGQVHEATEDEIDEWGVSNG